MRSNHIESRSTLSMQRMQSPKPLSAGWHGVAAAGGAIFSTLLLNPLDVVKVRLQNHVCMPACLVADTRPRVHLAGTTDTLVKIVRHEGVLTLWRGLGPSLLLAIPSSGIYFAIYASIKQRLQAHGNFDASLVPMYAGALARVFSGILAAPLDLIRTNLQALQKSHLGTPVSIGSVLRTVWAAPTQVRLFVLTVFLFLSLHGRFGIILFYLFWIGLFSLGICFTNLFGVNGFVCICVCACIVIKQLRS